MSEETQVVETQNTNGLATADELCGGGLKRRFCEKTLPFKGCKVRIRSLSEGEMGSYQDKLSRVGRQGGVEIIPGALKTANRRLIVLCLVDEQGNTILRNNHVGAMADWDAADVNYLYTACCEHCGVSREDLDQIVKNSAEAPID